MDHPAPASVSKFDPSRTAEYARQSRIALAGYDACHELSACILSASLKANGPARILVVGAGGTGGEIICAAKLEPDWIFTAVDPSGPMLNGAIESIEKENLAGRVQFINGDIGDIPDDRLFDAAIMIGVLHHLPGDDTKRAIMTELAARLADAAPVVVAGNYRTYRSEPLLMEAWAERWRMHGVEGDEIRLRMDRILEGAEPPHSAAAVEALFTGTGFESPMLFFSSLFWGAWHSRRMPRL